MTNEPPGEVGGAAPPYAMQSNQSTPPCDQSGVHPPTQTLSATLGHGPPWNQSGVHPLTQTQSATLGHGPPCNTART
eukprot:319361-Chlamydomonas_euryale.AAC.1